MHIADGILSAPVLAAGFGGTAIIAAVTMRKMNLEEIPKVSVMAAVFFVVNLIHIPVGPTSIHFIMNGLVGVILGPRAFAAVMLGVVLQAFLFGFGGVTVIGVNCVMLGGGALVAYFVWQLRHHFPFGDRLEMIFGALAGSTGVLVSGLILALALYTSGEEYWATAGYALAAHVPALIIEAIVVGACVTFLKKTRPDMLAGHVQKAYTKNVA
ncbi:MAG: cobalt transporter CbiM [Nitrospirae bacterium]|nr:cobalt transporter CbiM [Nitrospirota bacterium]